VNHFFIKPTWTAAQRAAQVEAFFAALAEKQRAGGKVFWTIHNYLNGRGQTTFNLCAPLTACSTKEITEEIGVRACNQTFP
jgi:hypothetical protein